jgi:hypothetical protein
MRASNDPKPEPLQLSLLTVREACSDDELKAAAFLRAKSFYVYPPEREFAGKVSFFFRSFVDLLLRLLFFSVLFPLSLLFLSPSSKIEHNDTLNQTTDPPGH